jgi:hypothetical protein
MVDRQTAVFPYPVNYHAMGRKKMTYQEIVKKIQTLPIVERLSLLEILAHSLQTEMQGTNVQSRKSILAEVRGMLQVEPLPSDEDLKEGYIDYLSEKYA